MGKGKRRVTEQYCERGSWLMQFAKPSTHICKHCNFTAKRMLEHCPTCGARDCMEWFGAYARPPRKNAPKRIWKKFRERYATDQDKSRHDCR
jgi:predicted ATP-dependent serine protease